MFSKILQPQQLVINWDESGLLANAHLVRLQQVLEDGVLISQVTLPALPLSISDFDGDNLKLAEVAEQVKTSGLFTLNSLSEKLKEADRALQEAATEIELLTAQRDHSNEANANAARELADTQDQLRMANESNRRMALDVDVAKHELDVANARLSSTRVLLLEVQEKYAQSAERVNELEQAVNGHA